MSNLSNVCGDCDQRLNAPEKHILVEVLQADDAGGTEELIEKEGIRNVLVTSSFTNTLDDSPYDVAFLISNDIGNSLAEEVGSDWWAKKSGQKMFFWIPVNGYTGHQISNNLGLDEKRKLNKYFSCMGTLGLNNFYDKSVSNLFNNFNADVVPDEWKDILKKRYLEERLTQQGLL